MSEGSEWYQIGPKKAWVTPLINKGQIGIILNLHMSPIPQTSLLVWAFSAASYSKTALDCKKRVQQKMSPQVFLDPIQSSIA